MRSPLNQILPILLIGAMSTAQIGCGAVLDRDPVGPAVSYHEDVEPILQKHCISCHLTGGIGAFDMEGYTNAKTWGAAIVSAIAVGAMPPWLPAPGLPFEHERVMTEDEKAAVTAWYEAGMPEGDPANAPANRDENVPTIEVDAELSMKAAYVPNSSGDDDYRCFVLDPGLTVDTAVTGFDITPGDGRVVHHVILFNVEKENFDRLQRLEDGTPGEGYTCFGAARVDATMIGAWVPGTTATVFPAGTGIVMSKKSKIVMQIHYNTIEVKESSDLTVARLEYAPASQVTQALIFPIGDGDFQVPPGEIGSVVRELSTDWSGLPDGLPFRIYGVAPHMHLLGKSISSWLVRKAGDGSKEMLIDIPKWDFHWQQMYFYEDPIQAVVGDKLGIECVWDNRVENQPFVNGERLAPTTVRWGEGTLEEMCLNFLYVTF